jgi:class 3 adenylate cyclase/tetratricopeptide (TPR) repeat protein
MDKSEVASGVPARAARRRYLTIMFSDLSDSTGLARHMEAENYSELLSQLRETYRQVIPRHGGTVVRIQGDGVLAIFGYPDAREDDGRRATEAALELHERTRRLHAESFPGGRPLSLHTGIHSGLVLVEEGDAIRGRFDLLGNATNVAARLAEAAARDEILVSEETLGSEGNFFETDAPRTLLLQGLQQLKCLPVLGRATTQTRLEARTRRGVAPFVGRNTELRALEHGLAVALAGKPRCMAISAAPGLGKTRLAEEFLRSAEASGCHVMRGYCESYLGAEPLQPILQMLRAAFHIQPGTQTSAAISALDKAIDRIDPVLRAHRVEFLRVLSLSATEAKARDTLLLAAQEPTRIALRDLFDRLSALKPLVVFVDDWQWADDITRQVVEAICQLESRQILVLIATRGFEPGEADMLNAAVLRMDPLEDSESAQIIERLLPTTDPFLLSQVCHYAGGNPLFIEELCHSTQAALRDQRAPGQPGGAAWLNTLIESRVARLSEEQARIVRCCAVIGNVIPTWLLHALTGVGEDDALIQQLSDQDLIFPGDHPDTLRFKHGITRDVVYEAVGLHERRALHRAVAQAIAAQRASGASEDAYEMLAYHYGAGGLQADAANFAELAGDKAIAASALDRAQAQFRAALAALDQLPASPERDTRWNSVAERLGLACIFDPSRDAIGLFERSVALASERNDLGAMARAHYWLGYIHYGLGQSAPATHHCEIALRMAQDAGSAPLVVQINATLGQVRAAACDYDTAIALLDDASSIQRRYRSSTRPAVGLAYSLACKGSILGDRGQFPEAHECFDEAIDAVRGAAHEVEGSVLCWRAGVLLWQGFWERARDDAYEARRIAERVKSLYVFAMSNGLGSYAEWMLERDPEALHRLANATSWLEQRDKKLFISLNYGWLAEGMAIAGRFNEARCYAGRAIVRARAKDRMGEAVAYRALAGLALEGHSRHKAEHYLECAMAAADARNSPRERALTKLSQAEVAAARGAYATAMHQLGESAAAFADLRMGWHLRHVKQRLFALQSDRTASRPASMASDSRRTVVMPDPAP